MYIDNDQGETLILAVVVDGPASHVRKVEIQSDLKDEKIVLYLRTGDGYAMDGLMQQNYTHGVPPVAGCNQECKSDDRRISIVFRHGKKKVYPKESGWPCMDLNRPTGRNPVYHGNIQGLLAGHLYSREVICRIHAHNSPQSGVSGNRKDGCDAIVVAGKGDIQGEDTILDLTYSASTSGGGADGMLVSQAKGLVIRVFRTTKYEHPHRAIIPADYPLKRISGAYYRYDGLYEIKKSEKYQEPDKSTGKKGKFVFQLSRCGEGHNLIGGNQYLSFCKDIGTLK